MMLTQMITVMSSSASAQSADASTASLIGSFLSMVVLFVLFYFIFMRPQRKKEKETQEMRNNIEIGDEIVTIGGIVGIVVRKTNEDTIVLETGGDRNKIRVKLWAVQENITAKEKASSAVSEEKNISEKKKNKKSDEN